MYKSAIYKYIHAVNNNYKIINSTSKITFVHFTFLHNNRKVIIAT